MKHRFLNTIILCLLLLSAVPFASCSHDAEESDMPSTGDGEMTLGIGFQIPSRADENEEGSYEEGETYENYIDVDGGNYRIYFFNAANTLIGCFDPDGVVTVEDDNYVEYSALGSVPESLASQKRFKMVVLANWPTYPEINLLNDIGKKTISDICNATEAQYPCLTDNNQESPSSVALNPNNKRLMPFYGIHEYSDVTFTPGKATILKEPVKLLRAMAKVEVIFETYDSYLELSSVNINRYNARGYCAPKDVFHQSNYDHNGAVDEDYAPNHLHLIGDMNDDGEKVLACRRVSQWKEGNKRLEKWTAYLPEYQNIDAGNAYSSIKAMFNIQVPDDTPHTIYFAKYTTDGITDNSNGSRMNIERNNIYRFKMTCTAYDYHLRLTVSDWEGLYKNSFEYGDGQFTTPPAPWKDEIDNDVEI